MRPLVALLLLFAVHLPGRAHAQPSGSVTLDAVRSRGSLVCGVSGTNPGFAFPDEAGEMRGSEADFCRAVAAATLGDASKVKWVILTSTTRFTALQSGEIDLLVRTATWTLSREASLGLDDRWAHAIIKQVGNYGETWDRDIAPLGIPRSLNRSWKQGGLQYAPPFR